MSDKKLTLDEIGPWSEVKLEILKKYVASYTAILSNQPNLKFYYIDAFSGMGLHKSKVSGDIVLGSPVIALKASPPFNHYYFIDLDGTKLEWLKNLTNEYANVSILEGDCNKVLMQEVFPGKSFSDYSRCLCLLDPYNIRIDWEVVMQAGKMRSVEIFLNFMLMDVNMNVVTNNPKSIKQSQLLRMDRFWGDRSWYELLYSEDKDLFGETIEYREAKAEKVLIENYRKRLKEIAGFKFVPKPIAMKTNNNATIYYLFFASQNNTGARIVDQIFRKQETK